MATLCTPHTVIDNTKSSSSRLCSLLELSSKAAQFLILILISVIVSLLNPPSTFLSFLPTPTPTRFAFPTLIARSMGNTNNNNKQHISPLRVYQFPSSAAPMTMPMSTAQDDVVDENVNENETENGATWMSIWLTGWLTMSSTNHTSRHGASVLDAQLVCFTFAKFSSLGLSLSLPLPLLSRDSSVYALMLSLCHCR